MVVTGDYLQLLLVKRIIFSRFTSGSKMNQLLSFRLLHLFKYAELTEFIRQTNQTFRYVLNSVRLGPVNENTESL